MVDWEDLPICQRRKYQIMIELVKAFMKINGLLPKDAENPDKVQKNTRLGTRKIKKYTKRNKQIDSGKYQLDPSIIIANIKVLEKAYTENPQLFRD